MRPPGRIYSTREIYLLVARGASRVVAVAGASAGTAGAAIGRVISEVADMYRMNTYLELQVHGLAIVI